MSLSLHLEPFSKGFIDSADKISRQTLSSVLGLRSLYHFIPLTGMGFSSDLGPRCDPHDRDGIRLSSSLNVGECFMQRLWVGLRLHTDAQALSCSHGDVEAEEDTFG